MTPNDDIATIQFTECPECGYPAEFEWRVVLPTTLGPMEHVKIRCVQRHWFFMPAVVLEDGRTARSGTPRSAASR